MPIRMIAKDLYKLEQEVGKLEAQLEAAASAEREALKEQLRRVRAERDRIRKMLDGEKVPPPYRPVR